MASDILVPTLGESVSEATVAQWLKQPGEPVALDEPVVELETDKVTLEVNAAEAGVLSEIVVEAGANVEVGALLGRIAEGAAAQVEAKSEALAASSAYANWDRPGRPSPSSSASRRPVSSRTTATGTPSPTASAGADPRSAFPVFIDIFKARRIRA